MNLIEQFSLCKRDKDHTDPLTLWRLPSDATDDESWIDEQFVAQDTGGFPEPDMSGPGALDPQTDLPPQRITIIGSATLAAKRLIIPGGEKTRAKQEFRSVKRALLLGAMASEDEATRRFMITSALPNEGKTFTAANLALSLAEEKDWNVLLVDADVARPSLPSLLEIPGAPGLMDALVDPQLDVLSLVRQTSIPNLSFLSAGKQDQQATELLSSAAMVRLVERLTHSDSRRLIVFDSPPLLVTTEAASLARHMGQIIVVVETGMTPRKAVRHALDLLDDCDASTSVLLNKAPAHRKAFGYGAYGYGYGYDGAN